MVVCGIYHRIVYMVHNSDNEVCDLIICLYNNIFQVGSVLGFDKGSV